jgi:hypothetical protein
MSSPRSSPPREKMISEVTESVSETDPTKNSAVDEILAAFSQQRISFHEATAHLEALAGSSEPMQRFMSAIQIQLPPPPVTIPGTRKKSVRWSADEDARLLAAIQAHGTENWPLVASVVGGGRTRAQCAQRWNRGLDPRICKTNWTKEEEEELLQAVQVHGCTSWTRIASEIGNRSDVQCRFRYRFLWKKAQLAGTPIQPISPSRPRTGQLGETLLIPLDGHGSR